MALYGLAYCHGKCVGAHKDKKNYVQGLYGRGVYSLLTSNLGWCGRNLGKSDEYGDFFRYRVKSDKLQ